MGEKHKKCLDSLYTNSKSTAPRFADDSFSALNNEEFFKNVISVWGLEETLLRQSIYFAFVASYLNVNPE